MPIKLYIYPNASDHVHDQIPKYQGVVPFSREGIKRHCEVVTDPYAADYFYMGQVREDSTVPLFKATGDEFCFRSQYPDRHIADMEGESGWEIPSWLHDVKLSTMGALKKFNIPQLVSRPTFSTMMVDSVKDFREFSFPTRKGMGFKGCINHPVRHRLMQAMELPALDECKVSREFYVNSGWAGSAPTGHPIHAEYEALMLKHPLSLCPRGAGIDTTRTIETCFYGRVPVIIADQDFHLVGEDKFDTGFCFKIIGDLSPSEIAIQLIRIYSQTSIDELRERGAQARKYFDTVIRRYFEDPTLYFLDSLKITT